MSESRKRFLSDLIMLAVAVVWGSGFVAQRFIAASDLSIFWINGLRCAFAVLVLLPFARFRITIKGKQWLVVGITGLALAAASSLQQLGITSTTASSAGFITGLYVVLVPLLLTIFWRQVNHWITWLAAALAVIGLGLLSFTGELAVNVGDLLVLGGSFMWALHVILIGFGVKKMDLLQFSLGQFIVCAVLNLIIAVIAAPGQVSLLPQNIAYIAYLGIACTGLGFTLQGLGQKHAPAADAAIILSMEAVFAALFGIVLLKESLSPWQWIGCGVILAAMLLAQGNTIFKLAKKDPAFE